MTDASRNYDVKNKRVAILATHGYQTAELMRPMETLKEAGATPTVVSLPESDGKIRGFSGGEWKGEVSVDATLP
ncbi:MAG TPA: DJ-1/PfpI family protein, partial [Longimicrobiales bacterium]|nr:DJ-1/PfpI family protein [Longimicrobiales bacterium]